MLAEEEPDPDVPVKHPSASRTRPESAIGVAHVSVGSELSN
jgi:hypothetical protein